MTERLEALNSSNHQMGTSPLTPNKIHAVDLFCGIGGLTYGLRQAGITVKAGYDTDQSCRYAYETNNPTANFNAQDVREIQPEKILFDFEGAEFTAIVGCAPCQPFSAHNRKSGGSQSENCSLLLEFARLINQCKPDVVLMENVPGLRKHWAFSEFLATLSENEYDFDYSLLRCSDYGVPQSRKRLVILASKLGKISLPRPARSKFTVFDYIGDLPAIEDGEVSATDPAHVSLRLSEINKRRIRQSKPGGSWKDWDESLVSDCHRKAYYPASYGRMRWDAPAPTVTTQFCYYSTGRFGHPEQDRTISVREGALLQTFPRTYKLVEQNTPISICETTRHIGNAVPVKLAEALGKSIVEVIDGG